MMISLIDKQEVGKLNLKETSKVLTVEMRRLINQLKIKLQPNRKLIQVENLKKKNQYVY